jgi:hypothetical protein
MGVLRMTEALIEFRLAATDEPIMLRVSQIQMLKPGSMAVRTVDGLEFDVTKEDWLAVEKAFRAFCGAAQPISSTDQLRSSRLQDLSKPDSPKLTMFAKGTPSARGWE